MALAETAVSSSFDILSYPRGAVATDVFVNLAPDAEGVSSDPAHLDVPAAEVTASFRELAVSQRSNVEDAMLITDRPDVAKDALAYGMGVVLVESSEDVKTALDLLLNPNVQTSEPLYKSSLYTDFSYQEIANALYKPGEINVVGFVGPTGAGKSTTIRRLMQALEEVGGHGGKFEVDAFFVRSRQDRKAWLNEVGISDAERTERQRVVNWWDLGLAKTTLERIKAGEAVHMSGLYDMEKGGEMVGTLDIDPGTEGYTVFVEGTALLVPEMSDPIDSFVYLNTHDDVRAQLLMERNTRDGYTPEESKARKVLTDAAETGEHISHTLRVARFIGGRLTVLDNTNKGEQLRLMPPFIPRR